MASVSVALYLSAVTFDKASLTTYTVKQNYKVQPDPIQIYVPNIMTYILPPPLSRLKRGILPDMLCCCDWGEFDDCIRFIMFELPKVDVVMAPLAKFCSDPMPVILSVISVLT